MDSITHILAPVLLTEPLPVPTVEQGAQYARWRERMAIFAGALLPDIDGTLGWIDPAFFAKYHRLVTHSIFGLIAMVWISALIAQKWPQKWLLPFMRRPYDGQTLVQPTFRRLVKFASVAVTTHWLGDWIAQWGIWPLWPFSNKDFSLGRVNSLDPVLLSLTVAAWTVQHLFLVRGKRKIGWFIAGLWFVAFAAYVWLRPYWGEPAFV